jgi:hypothetical protein
VCDVATVKKETITTRVCIQMVFNLIRSTDLPYAEGKAARESLLGDESVSESQIARNSGRSRREMDDYLDLLFVLLFVAFIFIFLWFLQRRARENE